MSFLSIILLNLFKIKIPNNSQISALSSLLVSTRANRVKNINYQSQLLAEKLVISDRLKKWRKHEFLLQSKKVFPTSCHPV